MDLKRMFNSKDQRFCQYHLVIEVDPDALDQCIAGGYEGYDQRWMIAWFWGTIFAQEVIVFNHFLGTINDIFDLEDER